MGKHDRDHRGDGQWGRGVPRDDVRDNPKDDGGKHGADKKDDDKKDDDKK